MKIVCISGKAQHGKDTSARFMKSYLESRGYKVLIAHFGDLVKYVCTKFFDWDGEKDQYGRSLLQYVGTDVVRVQEPDYWVDFIKSILTLFKDQWDFVLLPDCRFPNEYEHFINAGFDTVLVRVARVNFESPLSTEQQQHPSETAMDDYTASYYILNDRSLSDLERSVQEIAQALIKRED